MKAGECMNLINSFVCSERRAHQNYPCPYRGNFSKCKYFVRVTKEMEKDWNEKGIVTISMSEMPYNLLED